MVLSGLMAAISLLSAAYIAHAAKVRLYSGPWPLKMV